MKIILAIPNSSNTCPCLNFNVSANIHCIGRQLRLGTYVFKMQKLIHVGQSVGGHTVKIFLHLKYYFPSIICLTKCPLLSLSPYPNGHTSAIVTLTLPDAYNALLLLGCI